MSGGRDGKVGREATGKRDIGIARSNAMEIEVLDTEMDALLALQGALLRKTGVALVACETPVLLKLVGHVALATSIEGATMRSVGRGEGEEKSGAIKLGKKVMGEGVGLEERKARLRRREEASIQKHISERRKHAIGNPSKGAVGGKSASAVLPPRGMKEGVKVSGKFVQGEGDSSKHTEQRATTREPMTRQARSFNGSVLPLEAEKGGGGGQSDVAMVMLGSRSGDIIPEVDEVKGRSSARADCVGVGVVAKGEGVRENNLATCIVDRVQTRVETLRGQFGAGNEVLPRLPEPKSAFVYKEGQGRDVRDGKVTKVWGLVRESSMSGGGRGAGCVNFFVRGSVWAREGGSRVCEKAVTGGGRVGASPVSEKEKGRFRVKVGAQRRVWGMERGKVKVGEEVIEKEEVVVIAEILGGKEVELGLVPRRGLRKKARGSRRKQNDLGLEEEVLRKKYGIEEHMIRRKLEMVRE